jgi:hypothetical protein
MISKLRIFALIATGAILASTAGSALAMPSGYCSDYAGSAVREFYRAIHNPNCPGVSGLRWHADYELHYSWRLQASFDATTGEWEARREFLHHCG